MQSNETFWNKKLDEAEKILYQKSKFVQMKKQEKEQVGNKSTTKDCNYCTMIGIFSFAKYSCHRISLKIFPCLKLQTKIFLRRIKGRVYDVWNYM